MVYGNDGVVNAATTTALTSVAEPRSAGASTALSPPGNPSIGLADVERVRIEFAADPFEHFPMLGMERVQDRLEEALVARNAAAVLRRAGARPSDASDALK